jgi:hypothetical protein
MAACPVTNEAPAAQTTRLRLAGSLGCPGHPAVMIDFAAYFPGSRLPNQIVDRYYGWPVVISDALSLSVTGQRRCAGLAVS